MRGLFPLFVLVVSSPALANGITQAAAVPALDTLNLWALGAGVALAGVIGVIKVRKK